MAGKKVCQVIFLLFLLAAVPMLASARKKTGWCFGDCVNDCEDHGMNAFYCAEACVGICWNDAVLPAGDAASPIPEELKAKLWDEYAGKGEGQAKPNL
ncbi:hypothetical protein QJS04_geneDACA010212 [Acorus gramineus]|uniref:Uncharacterized protein n=1 Tax=Acorus gramineus TaxID=55184 RepID=A0AAV9A663_ACOGR|nr:hypothetical protein QJS04_geneDACA010212 [Acorus gramineus]